jgi:hypothetical protein
MDDFVPDNSWLMCDKGTLPVRLKVTHHNNTSLYGEFLASEADMIFGENVPPLGVCSVTRAPCSMQPIYWDKTTEAIKVNGYKLLVKDACLLCTQGGKISIGFSITEFLKNFTQYDGQHNGVLGAGLGVEINSRYLNQNFAQIASELRGVNPSKLPNTTLQGNFGEIRTVQDLKMKGYQITSISQATTIQGGGHQGLDITAYDPKSGRDIIVDSKYKSSTGKPRMSPTKTSGRQMSDRWLTQINNGNSRIGQALNPDDAARVTNKVVNGSDNLIRTAAKVEPNGKITYYEVDTNGKVLNPVEIPPANVVKGSSKAANLINDVSRSIQTNKTIATINNAIVDNADKIAKVGKVAGRAAIVVGIALDAISIYGAYQEDGGEIGTNTKQAVGSATGGMAGALLGAKAGAIIGAIGGPVGVIVGGVVGGIIGGLIGSGAGKWLGSLF